MNTYRVTNGQFIVEGIKLKGIKPVIAAYVQLVSEDQKTLYGSTTTDENGFWKFIFSSQLPGGRYIVKFIGSGMKNYLQPTGDWERIDFLTDSILAPPTPPTPIPPLAIELIMAGNISANTVEIMCVTNRETNLVINYGTLKEELTNTAVDTVFTPYHDIALYGLIMEQLYYFQAVVTDIYGNVVSSNIEEFYTSSQYTLSLNNKLTAIFAFANKVKSLYVFTPSGLYGEYEEIPPTCTETFDTGYVTFSGFSIITEPYEFEIGQTGYMYNWSGIIHNNIADWA